ncbi:MAG: GTP-binding protein [Pseudomonadota bacterium]
MMKRDDIPELQVEDRGVLRFLTCGSVDDGKSTLIGRLLYDTKALLADTLAALEKTSARRGLPAIDLSLATDGLVAEREQGITIDVAYRYFATARRKFIIADAPGHEQYTRNMVTAASTADAAVLLVDARKGILSQTKRHATIAALLGIRQLIVAVNKIDLVDFSQQKFDSIRVDFAAWLAQHAAPAADVRYLPLSALAGDNVVEPSERTPWYGGPTLVQLLEATPAGQLDTEAPLRLPVQWVCRPSGSEFRGYAGRIESGSLAVGDAVVVLPSGQRSRVARIALGETELQSAVAGQSVMVSLADERDVSRGDMLVRADEPQPAPRCQFTATVCWLTATPLAPARSYVLAHTTRSVKARVTGVDARLDIHTLAWRADGDAVALNDIVRVRFRTQQPLAADSYRANRNTGSFILIDEATNDTVAAGLID